MGQGRRKKPPLQKRAKSPMPNQPTPSSSWLRTLFGKAWFLVTVMAVLIALWQAWPRLSVFLGDSLDPKNPYSTLFLVSNEGYVPIADLNSECKMTFIDNRRNTIHETVRDSKFAKYLAHSDKSTLPCFKSLTLGQNASLVEVGDLTVTVTYSVYPLSFEYLRREKNFHFSAVRGPDGIFHWTLLN